MKESQTAAWQNIFLLAAETRLLPFPGSLPLTDSMFNLRGWTSGGDDEIVKSDR